MYAFHILHARTGLPILLEKKKLHTLHAGSLVSFVRNCSWKFSRSTFSNILYQLMFVIGLPTFSLLPLVIPWWKFNALCAQVYLFVFTVIHQKNLHNIVLYMYIGNCCVRVAVFNHAIIVNCLSILYIFLLTFVRCHH